MIGRDGNDMPPTDGLMLAPTPPPSSVNHHGSMAESTGAGLSGEPNDASCTAEGAGVGAGAPDDGAISRPIASAAAPPPTPVVAYWLAVILGVRFVDGMGRLLRMGGKVVKNAAGFDLPKFFVGSLGRFAVVPDFSNVAHRVELRGQRVNRHGL